MIAATLFGAHAASADSVQVQSYQRASQSEACTAQPGETPWQASWGPNPGWAPSWEQWANHGTGGWTCTRTITWATEPYKLGEIGPGGGVIFLISDGVHYEMAPRTWNGGASDPQLAWSGNTSVAVAGTSTAIGAGAANTTLIINQAGGGSTAGKAATSAVAYRGGGLSDWFLPSEDELNAMCNYSRTWTTTPSSGACTGAQDAAFASSEFGFTTATNNGRMWSSSSDGSNSGARRQLMDAGTVGNGNKSTANYVRPIRSF